MKKLEIFGVSILSIAAVVVLIAGIFLLAKPYLEEAGYAPTGLWSFGGACIKETLFLSDYEATDIILNAGDSHTFHFYRGEYDLLRPDHSYFQAWSEPSLYRGAEDVYAEVSLNGVFVPDKTWDGSQSVYLPDYQCGDNTITITNTGDNPIAISKAVVAMYPDESWRCNGIYVQESCTHTEYYEGCVTFADTHALSHYCIPGATTTTTIDPCAGVVCSPICDGNRRLYDGECHNGLCDYGSDQYCTYGCSGGVCNPQQTTTTTIPVVDCYTPSDCEGKYHPLGVGYWMCENNVCIWKTVTTTTKTTVTTTSTSQVTTTTGGTVTTTIPGTTTTTLPNGDDGFFEGLWNWLMKLFGLN